MGAAQTKIIQSHFITDCFKKDKVGLKCVICDLTYFAFYVSDAQEVGMRKRL